ncbi:MAG: flagellar FliJ family protein [Alphaproteobacteria bacterium]|nr:flagellar FliJ family protein [Alphaproteobacteria bacterium]
MQFLKTLARLHEHTILSKKKDIATLYDHKEKLEESIVRLKNTLEEEKSKLGDDISFHPIYIRFVQHSQRTITALGQSLATVEASIAVMEEQILDAFSEKKKADLLFDQHQSNEQTRLQRKSNEQLDEIGIRGYTKNQNDQE